mgnify:CR=1 FL=1
MEVHKLLETLHIAERLKDELRHCDTSKGRRESVAEHSWRIALMALFMQDEFPELDINKVIRMCLIHDLGECFTGDIPTFLKTAEDEQKEDRVLADWVASLPEPYCRELAALAEYIDALTGAVLQLKAEIYVLALVERLFLLGGKYRKNSTVDHLVRKLGVLAKFAVDAHNGGSAYGEVDIGGVHFSRLHDEFFKSHGVLPSVYVFLICCIQEPRITLS